MEEPDEPEVQPLEDIEQLDGGTPATYDDDDYSANPFGNGSANDGGALRFLGQITQVAPFLDLFDRSPTDNRLFLAICITLDLLLRIAVWLLIVGIVAFIAWKAVFPLPPIQQ